MKHPIIQVKANLDESLSILIISFIFFFLRHCLLLSHQNDLNVPISLVEWERVQFGLVDPVHKVLLIVFPTREKKKIREEKRREEEKEKR